MGRTTHAAAGASRSLSGFVRSSVCMCLSCGWYPVFISSTVDGILRSFLQLWTVSCIHFFSCGRYPVFISSAVDGIMYSFLQLWTVSCIHFFKSNTIQHACACSYSQWMCQSSQCGCRTCQTLDIASTRLYFEFQNALQSDDSVLCFTPKKGDVTISCCYRS